MLASLFSFLFLLGSFLTVAAMVGFGLWYLLKIWKRSSLAPKPRDRSPQS